MDCEDLFDNYFHFHTSFSLPGHRRNDTVAMVALERLSAKVGKNGKCYNPDFVTTVREV